MPSFRPTLFVLAGAAACHTSRPAPVPDAPAVMAEVERMGARDLWPGFDPRSVPVALFDGERTWLFQATGVVVRPGRDSLVVANSSVMMNGVATATVMPFAARSTLAQRAAVVVHESFHVFQRARHPRWTANEGELFTYPITDGALLALRRLESEALRRGLDAGATAEAGCWARAAVAMRRARFARMSPGAATYERQSELNEGLASYVQHRARVFDEELMPAGEFPAEDVRQRVYASGPALGRLLDRLSPEWRATLERRDSMSLDALLEAALTPGDDPCAFTAAERERIERSAAADAGALSARLAGQRRDFLAQPGWRVVIVGGAGPLWPQGFDPLNVRMVSPGEVLHTRMLKLGNDAGALEILGRASLTEAAGAHPLFNGVRRLSVTGLTAEPRVTETGGVVRLEADGLQVEFRGARVVRSAETVELRLGP